MDEWTGFALAARDGDERAAAELVRCTQVHVWRLCARLGDRDHADDLAQETYLRAFAGLASFRGEAPVRSWLATIARRVVADDIACRQRHRMLRPGLAAYADLGDGALTHELVARLDPDRREAFVLTQLLDFSYAEVAALCGCPVGTVRSRVARARAELVGHLATDGVENAG
ncbi:RNA polymerase sigma factor SigC [Nocardioides maradonensis]